MALLHAELTATCNSLGCAGAEKYCIDPQCSEAIRDLIKFLRRDGDDHDIRRFLGVSNIVQTDLLPILVEYSDKSELFDLIIRLLVNLTTPALLLYNEQPPIEKTPRQYYLQMILHLQKYKQAFTNIDVWKIIVNKLAEVIQAEYHEKGEEKVLSTVRLLILIRNILHVPADNDAECRPDNDASLHDQVLWAMHQSQLIDVIMYIACSDNEQQYYLHALEIISLMLRDQVAAELANASVNRTETEKQRDEQELKTVLEKERQDKMVKLKKYSGLRHSRFGGRFVVSGMKSIGENEMVVSSMSSNVNKAFDRNKKPLKTPRNRMPMKETGIERKSAFSVRFFLKEFCVEFLHGAYNTLMKHVREILVRSKGQPNDESYYFWAMQFFMEFNRNYKFEIKLVSETMALHIFHFVQERIEESREKLITDKKKIHVWSKRMHLGLKAYKELMDTLFVMYKSKDPVLESSARTILTNIFYMVEYRDLLLSLFNLYDGVKFSRLYLKDLIETNHVFMKLLENLGKKQRNLIVQRKTKKKKATKKSKTPTVVLEDNDTMWANFSPDLEKIIDTLEEVVDATEAKPYDPVSEVPMDEQKVEAMCRIRILMRTNRLEPAVILLRASREVWPEDSYFGKPGLSSNEELDILKQIFYADLGNSTGHDENMGKVNNGNNDDDNESDEEDEEEESSQIRMEEENFEFTDFVKKFAKPKVLQSCCQLLKEFDKNSTHTNHAIVKLLHRITYDCKYSAMMFQASVFRIFQKIFLSKNVKHKELKNFAIFILRKFTDVAKKNDKVFVELLFWKDLKVAYEIEEGYDADENKKTANWSEEQEDELHRLHEEYIRDMPKEDETTWICKNLIRQDRSKISVNKKLKQLGIVPKKLSKMPAKEFSEVEIAQISQLVEVYREASNPMSFIMEKLDVKRPKKHIVDKILELGLVKDRKELRKKRYKNTNKISGVKNSSSDESDESDDDDDDDQEQPTYHSLTSIYVLNAIKKVIDKDMKPALLWLVESLDEAADDLGVDESDITLLPLTDECMMALNDIDFQEAMKIIGLHEPKGIQETYWRIPGKWQANDIHQRSMAIKKAIEGNFVAEDYTSLKGRIDDSSDEDVEATFDRIRKSLVQNTINDNTNKHLKVNLSKVSEESNNKKKAEFKYKVALNKRKCVLEDSDVEVNSKERNISSDDSDKEGNNINKNLPSKKKKMLLEDSDEEEVSQININYHLDNNDVEVNTKKKNISSDDSDKEDNNINKNPPSKKKKMLLEDSDEEEVSQININYHLDNNDVEVNTKEKNISSDNSDVEVNTKRKNISSDNSDEEDNNIKKNLSSKKKKMFLEDSDSEEVSQINKNHSDNNDVEINTKNKTISSDDNNEEEVNQMNERHELDNSNVKLTFLKKKKSLDDSDNEDDAVQNYVPTKKKKLLLKDNDEENSEMSTGSQVKGTREIDNNKKSVLPSDSDSENEIERVSKKSRLKDNQTEGLNTIKEKQHDDSEEEVGSRTKKNKYFINDDSD